MISEPYICIKGRSLGEIRWNEFPEGKSLDTSLDFKGDTWQRYADFEREKLRALRGNAEHSHIYRTGDQEDSYAYNWTDGRGNAHKSSIIGYAGCDFENDSESCRLLKRAAFLKAVCEKEGVEWLPKSDIEVSGGKLWIGETEETLAEVRVKSITIEFSKE